MRGFALAIEQTQPRAAPQYSVTALTVTKQCSTIIESWSPPETVECEAPEEDIFNMQLNYVPRSFDELVELNDGLLEVPRASLCVSLTVATAQSQVCASAG